MQKRTEISCQGYLSALRHLYAEQNAMGINLAPPPKGHVFQLLMKSILYSKASLKRIEERDRGEGTLRDG